MPVQKQQNYITTVYNGFNQNKNSTQGANIDFGGKKDKKQNKTKIFCVLLI